VNRVLSKLDPNYLVSEVGGRKVFQFLTEEPFYVILKPEAVSVLRGVANLSDVEVEGPSSVLEDVVLGKLSPVDAVLNGTLKVKGDLTSAGKLVAVVRRAM